MKTTTSTPTLSLSTKDASKYPSSVSLARYMKKTVADVKGGACQTMVSDTIFIVLNKGPFYEYRIITPDVDVKKISYNQFCKMISKARKHANK